MKTYVISLSNSGRRPKITERLKKAGLTFDFIDAINKDKFEATSKLSNYDEKGVFGRYGRQLTPAEIACFNSHIKTWEVVAQQDCPCIILEDDALFNYKVLSNLIEALSDAPTPTWDALLLGQSKLSNDSEKKHYFYNPIIKNKTYRGFVTGSPFKLWTSGMVGYVLTPLAALKLLKSNSKISCVADDWEFHSTQGIVVEECRPYVVWEDYKNTPSTIEDERKKASKPICRTKDKLLHPLRIVRALYRQAKSIILSTRI